MKPASARLPTTQRSLKPGGLYWAHIGSLDRCFGVACKPVDHLNLGRAGFSIHGHQSLRKAPAQAHEVALRDDDFVIDGGEPLEQGVGK
jgi:hypothetical protein